MFVALMPQSDSSIGGAVRPSVSQPSMPWSEENTLARSSNKTQVGKNGEKTKIADQ